MRVGFFAMLIALLAVNVLTAQESTEPPFKTVTFQAPDGITVTGDLYMKHDSASPFIVLCHQARWSRGEYREIAPKLNDLGFNCLAIDQRSGGTVNGVDNRTHAAATKAGKPTLYADAEPDMIAALKWAKSNHAKGKLLLWGSSYSAALTLRIAGENPDLVDGALAFAPGEYFERFGKPGDWITLSARKIGDPVFVTSAKNEYKNWQPIFEAIPGTAKTKFLPTTNGNHGSRALWEQFDDHRDYWTAVKRFLTPFKG